MTSAKVCREPGRRLKGGLRKSKSLSCSLEHTSAYGICTNTCSLLPFPVGAFPRVQRILTSTHPESAESGGSNSGCALPSSLAKEEVGEGATSRKGTQSSCCQLCKVHGC